MHVFNQNAPGEFYQAFAELVRNSTLRGRAGSITLFTDWATMEQYAALTSSDSSAPKPLGRGSTPSALFLQVLASIEPRPIAPSVPGSMQHPGPGRWWWLCFVDPEQGEGRQFLGVAVVEGATLRHAMERATTLRIHPGGRVASVACTLYVPAARWRNRLLTREEVICAGNEVERPVSQHEA